MTETTTTSSTAQVLTEMAAARGATVPTAAGTAGATPVRAPDRPPGAAMTSGFVAGRTVRVFLRDPKLLASSAAGGTMFLLLFLWVFGGAMGPMGSAYVDHLVPGFIAANLLMAGMNASAGVAADLEGGLFDRLRSLPVPRVSILAGRASADTALLGFASLVTLVAALAAGFRPDGSLAELSLAFVLCAVVGYAFTWVAILVGMAAGSPQAAQGLAMLAFPLGFLSSAYVPVDTMPAWLQPIAQHQPVTAVVDAVRALTLGSPEAAGIESTAGAVGLAFGWAAVILAVAVPLTVARFRR